MYRACAQKNFREKQKFRNFQKAFFPFFTTKYELVHVLNCLKDVKLCFSLKKFQKNLLHIHVKNEGLPQRGVHVGQGEA